MGKDSYEVKGYEVSDYKIPELTDGQKAEVINKTLGVSIGKVNPLKRIGVIGNVTDFGQGMNRLALEHAHTLPNVIIVMPPEEPILIKNFKEYMSESWIIDKYYGGETIPRLLIKIGLNTWYKLEAEYLLIKNKKSNHNRHIRTCIEKAYNMINKM